MTCSRCGAPLQNGWRACPNCGLQFPSPVSSFNPTPAPTTILVKKPPITQNGCMISASLLFCFPIGLIFLWLNPKYSIKLKSIVTGLIALLVISVSIYNASPAGQHQAALDAQQQAKDDAQATAQQKQQATADAQAARQTEAALPRVSVDTLVSAYSANEIAANNRFDNKEFILIGTVGQISTAVAGQDYVTIDGSTPSNSFTPNQVTCYFSDDQSNQLAQLQKGQSIQVDGKCGGMPIGLVVMNDCAIK